jgi:hypothetical protein
MKLKLLAFGAALVLAIPVANAQKVLKYAHFQPAKDDQPKHVAALAFKEHVEKATNGSIKVEIYPAGQFGKDQQTMEGVKLGTLELAVAHDGAVATIYKPIGVLGIPFLYDNHEHAWRVYDSKWKDEASADMVKKTGIRLLGLPTTASATSPTACAPIQSPADMKGMKMRIQPSPGLQGADRVARRLGLGDSLGRAADRPAAEGGRRPGERRDQHHRRQPVPEPEVRHARRPRLVDPRLHDERTLLPGPQSDAEKKAVDEATTRRWPSTAR